MFRFIAYAVPLLLLQLALFGFAVELLDVEPRSGSVIRLALLEQPRVPGQLVLGAWLVEASGLIALFLLTQGRFGRWWLDGLVAGWVGWIFRGPLLVITIVVAARQPQDTWWTLAFGWWVLYSACGLSLALLARRSGLEPWQRKEEDATAAAAPEPAPPAVTAVESVEEIESENEVPVEPEDVEAAPGELSVEPQAVSEPEDEETTPVTAEPDGEPRKPPDTIESAAVHADAAKA